MYELFKIKPIDQYAVDYLVRNLKDFEKNRSIKSGLAAAGKLFKDEGGKRLRSRMKAGRKGVTGNLLRSIDFRVKKHSLGMLVGFKQGKGGGSHASWIDSGTDERFWIKKGKSIGRVTGNYFWTDTKNQDYPQAINMLYQGIERAVSRINKRQ
ncbi:MAG: hypothetical protein LBP83_05055 [Dysgonamonadaceae bacterium]|jgi:hypothetical protein|nr:hypothetical protein [Dysgonamonadaceae bacterium]